MQRSILFVLFAATVLLANWLIVTFGLVPVGMGLVAPAGVYAAGLAFVIRDGLHDTGGRRWVLGAIAVGAALSAVVSPPALALASGLAFATSETADMLVYTPLRRRSWLLAAVASNTVGLVVDSALFLWLAFGSLEFLAGQVVGKFWVTALAVSVWALLRRRALVTEA